MSTGQAHISVPAQWWQQWEELVWVLSGPSPVLEGH